RPGDRDQPGAAVGGRRARAARSPAGAARPGPRRAARPVAPERGGHAVHRAGRGGIGPLRADRRQPGRGRRAVPPAGRSAAGYRAGRGPDPGPGARADTRPPQRPVQPAHRRQPGRAPAPPDAAHHLEWSFDLLTAPEQAMLTRLCVFAGRFTLDDVEPVCCSGDVAAAYTLDLLSSLIDKSLVIKEDADGTACYRLLETMREYARLRLREAGEEDAVERRCADHYLSRCAQFALEGRYRLLDWLAWAELEIDNVRA